MYNLRNHIEIINNTQHTNNKIQYQGCGSFLRSSGVARTGFVQLLQFGEKHLFENKIKMRQDSSLKQAVL